jgi:serine/threonine protein kinase
MARIYIARSTGIGAFERYVVLKVITAERANDITAVQMFLDEARLAASLNHQNVAQVFEVGEDAGIHYLAMEYVHGQDLRAVLVKAGSMGTRVPLDLALTVVAGAAAGLDHAHERCAPDGTPLGIVHRDVSPSNVMVGYDGSVKLLDFGIAKAAARSVETQAGIIKGKFAYMAPEQCRGQEVDRRSDVFSLGIILYEVTTQHRCFRAESDFDTMHRIVTGDVVPPNSLVEGYPAALEAIVMQALEIDANRRYQSAGLLLEAVESFAADARISLSTMSLGRFMRDTFGDMPEPWLVGASRATLMPPTETTISQTGETSDPVVVAARPSGSPRLDPSATVPNGQQLESALAPELYAWNQPGDPEEAPTFDSPDTPQLARARHPWFAPVPAGLGADRAQPGVRPNRRYWVVGGVLLLAGVIAGAVLGAGRHENQTAPAPSTAGTSARPAAPTGAPGPQPPNPTGAPGAQRGAGLSPASSVNGSAPAAQADASDGLITVHLDTIPSNADVLIAGAKVGTTPFDRQLRRDKTVAPLTVRRAGYLDYTAKIDLSDDFSAELRLKPAPVARASDAPTSVTKSNPSTPSQTETTPSPEP